MYKYEVICTYLVLGREWYSYEVLVICTYVLPRTMCTYIYAWRRRDGSISYVYMYKYIVHTRRYFYLLSQAHAVEYGSSACARAQVAFRQKQNCCQDVSFVDVVHEISVHFTHAATVVARRS